MNPTFQNTCLCLDHSPLITIGSNNDNCFEPFALWSKKHLSFKHYKLRTWNHVHRIWRICLLNFVGGAFLLFCEFCGICFWKKHVFESKKFKRKKKKEISSIWSLCLFQCCFQSIYKAKKLKLMVHLHIFTIARQ